MNAISQTSTSALPQASGPSAPRKDAVDRQGAASAIERVTLIAILALSAVMNVVSLDRNGYANNFYSAGVKSMLRSLHNFLYVSSDPGGLITIDKPPLSMWLQVASTKVFGFAPLPLLLPEAIAGVLSVLVLYLALSRALGRTAALMGALSLAVFPAFVAVSRDNNPDALLILLMCIACWLALRAIASGRLITLLACALAVGLAFNTKTLAAYLVVPGIAAAYVICAPGTLQRRVLKLLAAGVLLAVLSLAWVLYVDGTSATHRPFVGSTDNNSEFGLAFEYNGLGRLDGQSGGPSEIPQHEGASVPLTVHAEGAGEEGAEASGIAGGGARPTPAKGQPGAGALPPPATMLNLAPFTPSFMELKPVPPTPSVLLPNGRARNPTPFAKKPSPLRLLEKGLNTQAGWLVPLSLLGLVALALWILDSWRHGAGESSSEHAAEQRRSDPRLAVLLVFGGWFLVEALFLSLAKGIVHPYYTSELGPGTAAMVGAGLVAFGALMRRRSRWAAPLFAIAVLLTAIAQVSIFDGNHYMRWFGPVLIVAAVGALLFAIVSHARAAGPGLRARLAGADSRARLAGADSRARPAGTGSRARPIAVWATLGVLLIAPAVYSAATWSAPVNGTFPAAGPRGAPGYGGVDAKPEEIVSLHKLLAYLARKPPHTRFSVLTVASVVSSPLILMGTDAASLAGYSGTDPAVSSGHLAHMVSNGEARYVLLGGPYSSRGGNSATRATLAACRMVRPGAWGNPRLSAYSFVLFDCAGRAQALYDWHPS